MKKHILTRVLASVSIIAFLSVLPGNALLMKTETSETLSTFAAFHIQPDLPLAYESKEWSLPGVLAAAEMELYQRIRAFQSREQWADADALLADLENADLKALLLAARLTDRRYEAPKQEYTEWLKTYPEHPMAAAVAARVNVEVRKKPLLQGYGDDTGLVTIGDRLKLVDETAWIGREPSRVRWQAIEDAIASGNVAEAREQLQLADSETLLEPTEYDIARWDLAARELYRGNAAEAYSLASKSAARSGQTLPLMHWVAGIAAWQIGQKADAATHFKALAESELASPWQEASAAYWAYRALNAIGNVQEAAVYLQRASEHPRTFYGILARKALDQPLGFTRNATVLSQVEIDALYQEPAIRQAVAYAQVGDTDSAEKILRSFFLEADKAKRSKLLPLASALNLPAVQISMAKQLIRQGVKADSALYPMPGWEPNAGFALDPALVFAFARQESGFRADAKGAGGAAGLMQLMPATAQLMKKKHTSSLEMSILEPEANITLGERYLKHLMATRDVGYNLFYLIAAYNAGPGKVAEWKGRIHANGDPLLFVELIPFGQTRNYVMQVLANFWIYQELEGKTPKSAIALANGRWPQYDAESSNVAELR